LTLAGAMAVFYVAWDVIALMFDYYLRSSSETGADAVDVNVSVFVLAVFLAIVVVGLAILVAGVVQVRRNT
jgi:hypothetical protein